MNLYLIMIIILIFMGSKIFIKDFNKEYLSKDTTSSIKGIFILIVFYSHLKPYTIVQKSKDFMMLGVRNFLGQLMVTLFLFYSGYGIYESIKNKKQNYIKTIPSKRIFITWFNFAFVVLLYEIINIFIKRSFPLKNNLLSFTGWDSIGNSNWYIFGILFLYLITYLSFTFFDKDNKKAIITTWIYTLIFCLFLSLYKDDFWFNTLLCFPLGLTYSYFKNEIEGNVFENKKYIISLGMTFASFLILYKFRKINWIYYEILSMNFSLIVILITTKININNKMLRWLGNNLFWIYILQRIPMLVYRYLGLSKYAYKYALACFITTIILTFIFSKIFTKADDKILSMINKKSISIKS